MTHEEIALEEIKKGHPTAYEILKKALPEKFIPYFKDVKPMDIRGNITISKCKNKGGSLCLQGFDMNSFAGGEGVDQGVLKIGLNTYKLTNVVAISKEKHRLDFAIKKLEAI